MCLAHSGNPYGTLTTPDGKLLDEKFIAKKVGLTDEAWLKAYDFLMEKRRIAIDPLTDAICIPKMVRDGKPCKDPILAKIEPFMGNLPEKPPAVCPVAGDNAPAHTRTPPASDKPARVKGGGEFAIPDPFPEKRDEAWSLWVKYRKHRKCPVSFAAAVLQKRMLDKYDEATACNIIATSIQNDWRGLFEPKQHGGNYGRNKQQEADRYNGQFKEPDKKLPIG